MESNQFSLPRENVDRLTRLYYDTVLGETPGALRGKQKEREEKKQPLKGSSANGDGPVLLTSLISVPGSTGV